MSFRTIQNSRLVDWEKLDNLPDNTEELITSVLPWTNTSITRDWRELVVNALWGSWTPLQGGYAYNSFIAEEEQEILTLDYTYENTINPLLIFKDWVKLQLGTDYTQPTNQTVSLTTPAIAWELYEVAYPWKWEKWDTGDTWPQWEQGEQGIQGIQWEQGIQGETWPAWVDWKTITSVTSNKVGKTTTVTVDWDFTWAPELFEIEDWLDWEGSWDMLASTYDPIGWARQVAFANEIPDTSNFETTTQLNARDTANRERDNHTWTQAISTITDLQSELNWKANTWDLKFVDGNNPSHAVYNQWNVGIGTNAPIGKLDVADGGWGARIFCRRINGEFFRMSAGTAGGGLAISDTASVFILGKVPKSTPNASLSGLMTIRVGSGNIGIWTSNPSSKLHVTGAITQTPLSSDPADPSPWNSVQWVSNWTGSWDAGDVMMKINVWWITKIVTIVDYSVI